MGLVYQKEEYDIISDEDDSLFRELIIGKTITEVNKILSEHDYYYRNTLIDEICDGECGDDCDHDVIVDTTDDGKIIQIYKD